MREFFANIADKGAENLVRETPDYQNFLDRYFTIVFIVSLSAPWLVYLLVPNLSDLRYTLGNELPIFYPKLRLVSQFFPDIVEQYVASSIALLALVPFFVFVNALFYFKHVVLCGAVKRINRDGVITTLFMILLIAISCDAIFFDGHERFDPKYPGKAAVIYSGIFPIFSGIAIFFTSMSGFPAILGMAKTSVEIFLRVKAFLYKAPG